MAKTSALAVANFLLDQAAAEHRPIAHLKLQKLVYYCYAWYAGNEGEELFSEDIEAWRLGPVVREVYLQFRDCGSGPINKRATTLDWDTLDEIEPQLSDELRRELLPVWNVYKGKSAAWLVEATHLPDEPWGILTAQYGTSEKRKIPFDLVKKVYAEKVSQIGS